MDFQFEHYKTHKEVIDKIQECEGRHSQQVAYSSFHNCLTQVCFGCRKIRSNISIE